MNESPRRSSRQGRGSEGVDDDAARIDPQSGVLDATNLYAAGKLSRPYLTVPSWLRRFMFKVLRPRQLSVYVYLLSLTNKNGIAFPLTQQIVDDLGLRDRDVVVDAIDALEELGFILRERRTVDLNRVVVRNVYQRPSTEYTLLTLLQTEKIDGELYPTDERGSKADRRAADDAIKLGLETLTADAGAVERWADEEDIDRKKTLLIAMLERSQTRRRRYADHM